MGTGTLLARRREPVLWADSIAPRSVAASPFARVAQHVCDPVGMDDRLMNAVLDNATWCHLVCSTLGIEGRFEADAWVSPRRTPPGYPDAVTLIPDASGGDVLSRIDGSDGCSVKDSFADLDLESQGFRILFDARWICREAGPAPAPGVRWTRVTQPVELRAWALQHGGGPTFSDRLLAPASVVILAAHDAGELIGGAIASVADAAVGILNVFVTDSRIADAGDAAFMAAFAGATGAIAERFPDRPIVGYLAGAELAAARAAGYEEIGPLRVWLKDGS